ncbi:MAG: hypothetical protein KF784_03125 [Fimbriimonadaceae bacterium]|nr:hypothetical protein [Fimbriimonadaceae bacterium]
MSEEIVTTPFVMSRKFLLRHSLRAYRRWFMGTVTLSLALVGISLTMPNESASRAFTGLLAIYAAAIGLALWLRLMLTYARRPAPWMDQSFTYTITPASINQRSEDGSVKGKFKFEAISAYAVTEDAVNVYLTRTQFFVIPIACFPAERSHEILVEWLDAKRVRRKKI